MQLKFLFIALLFLACNPMPEQANTAKVKLEKEKNIKAGPIKKKLLNPTKPEKKSKKSKGGLKKTTIKRANPPTVSYSNISYKEKNYDTYHKEAKAFCKKEKYNKDFYFLVDYSLPSGKNRFLIYDFKKDSIVVARLVTHGACDAFEQNTTRWEKAKFSDKPNSHCSSSGKYKIGKRDYSSWGINVKYWIKGLESTNKSAEERVVVLHSWHLVSDEEIYPTHSPLSWGCPAVSNNFMKELDLMLQGTNKPVLLWVIGD